MSQRLVLFAKTILTLDRPRPIEDGFILLQGPRILQVGKRADLHLRPSVRVLDLGETLLLPGLINAHCHLDFTAFKGRVPYRQGFRDWLRRMAVKTRATTLVEFRRSIQKGIQESLDYGTTTLCDVATSGESYPLLRRSSLRSFVFFELLDMARPSAKAYWKGFLEELRERTRHASPTTTCRWGLAPHTPFTVSKELLQMVRHYLHDHGDLLTTIHVAESREETSYFKKGKGPMAERIKVLNPDWTLPHGTTPVQYLNNAGWLPKLDLGVHLNEVDAKDLKSLAKNRTAVVHCPGSHAFFGHRPFQYPRMKKKGIPVCLGTDSLASNHSLSMFREMRLFKKEFPEVTAMEVLSLATFKAAQALGMGGQLGQIKPGYLADIIGIPMARGSSREKSPAEQAVAYKGTVSFSMVNGEPRLRVASSR